MALIQVNIIDGVFTAQQKREIIERLTDAMVEIEGENMRQTVWCVIEEVANGAWGIAGQALTRRRRQGAGAGHADRTDNRPRCGGKDGDAWIRVTG